MEPPATTQAFERCGTPFQAAILLAFQCRIVVPGLEYRPQRAEVPLGYLPTGIYVQDQSLVMVNDFDVCPDDISDLLRM